MDDFDKDPLDLFDDDGDGVVEMCVLFDEDGKKNKQGGSKPPINSGCCVVFLMLSSSLIMLGWSIMQIV